MGSSNISTWVLDPERCFAPDPTQRQLAGDVFTHVRNLPLICPHGHVIPSCIANDSGLGSPSDLFVISDHYVFRMLHSQGIALEDLGIPSNDGRLVEVDHRQIWQKFSENFHLFRGTPTALWLKDELINVFGISSQLNGDSGQDIYDELEDRLRQPAFRPRALFDRFDIEVLCTTDAATDSLEHHSSLHEEGWGRLRPTFRPDGLLNLDTPDWHNNIQLLSSRAGIDICDYRSFVEALKERRVFFKSLGATATDHGAHHAHTNFLSENEVQQIFDRALRLQDNGHDDTSRFTAHMLLEMARMSCDDGLVMQLHVGSFRNHSARVFDDFGPDMGADIPVSTEWTQSLQTLLNTFGTDPNFRVIIFTLDETTYSRELAPLAGFYPSLRLGPPWWFFDSVLGIERYLDSVIETAGIYNTVGFNDDTRAFASIPARHDVWRRVTSNWIAGRVVRGLIDEDQAADIAWELAYGLAKRAYRL